MDKKTAPADVAAGVKAILEWIQAKQPEAKILLPGIFPRGEKLDANREKITAVNDPISKFQGGAVHYMDISAKFLQAEEINCPDPYVSYETSRLPGHPRSPHAHDLPHLTIMTSKERVQTALAHQQPDRVPLEMSFTPEFAQRLRTHLFGGVGERHNPHGGGNDYALELELGLDVLLTSVGWANSYYAGDIYNPGADHYTDEWGIGWKNIAYQTRFGPGFYTEFHNPPLAEESALDSYQPPDPNRPELYTAVERTVRDFGSEYWIVGSCQTTIWETAVALRGFENLLMDLIDDPDLVGRILDIPQRYHTAVCRRLVELGVDMIWLGDDIGAQQSMIMSPDQWRMLLKPRFAKLIAELKSINPAIKIAYHTDGYVEPVIGELIEIGIDVLHPVQPACMDPAKLKQQFGDRLCFMGSVDVQRTLPFGSVDDVRREVRERIRTLGKNGGLILAPTHHVQLDTPIENLLALVETAKDPSHGV